MSPLTGVLGEAWQLYKRYAAHFLVIAFVIYLPAAVIVGLLYRYAGWAGSVLAWVIDVFAFSLVGAALVKAVQDVRDGRVDMDLGQTISAALPYLLPVAAAWIMAEIGIGIGLVLVIVPGLILLTFWSLIVPSIVVGEAGVFESFGHSWRTVRGYAWRVFGTGVLVILIWFAFRIVLALIFLALPAVARYFIADVVSGTLFVPFLALVITLIYYRLTAAHAAQEVPAGAQGWTPPGTPPPGAPGGPPPGGTTPQPQPTTPQPPPGPPPPGPPPPGQPG